MSEQQTEATEFVYDVDMQDKDATNARSTGLRTLRDLAGLATDQDGKLTTEMKDLHTNAANAARSTVIAIEKGLIARRKRAEWSDEIVLKAIALMYDKSAARYREEMEAKSFTLSDEDMVKGATAHNDRLIERRFQTEADWRTQKELDSGGELDAIFA